MRGVQNLEGGVAENSDFRQGGHYPPSDDHRPSCRSDALYPALSGEWEVPVIRNAKITPVNEGGGGRGRGASPPGSPLAGSPVTRNAEIDPPPRLR